MKLIVSILKIVKFVLSKVTLMRVPLSLLFCIILSVTQLYGQNLDSLKNELELAKNPKERIDLLFQVGNILLAEKKIESISYFEEVIEIGEQMKDKPSVAKANSNLGVFWYHQNDLKKSSQFYFEALEQTTDEPAFDEIRLRLYNNLGWNFKRLNDPAKALKYFKKAEVFARMEKHSHTLGSLLNNLGVVQKDLGLYEASLASLSESLAINEKSKNTDQIRYNLNNMGVVLYQLKKYEESIKILDQVLEMNIEARDTIEIINNYLNLGLAYHKTDRPEEAKLLLLETLQLKPHLLPENEEQIYLELDQIYSKLGDFENARSSLDNYIFLKDSMQQLNLKENVFELEAKYNSLLKDKDLEQARKNLAEQKLYLSLFVFGFIVVLVSAVLIWINYRQKKKSEAKLKTLYETLEIQSQKLQESNEQISKINENLESIIQQRTSVIESQNQRLIGFAFMNSHKIRGPVATLLGLISLLEDDKNKDIQADLIKNSKDTIQKLDAIIHDVNNQLQEEGIEANQS